MIELPCSHCGQVLVAQVEWAGKNVKCPTCGGKTRIAPPPSETATLPPSDPRETATLPPSESAPAAVAGPAAIPGYDILGELGRGGMGVVYKARQTKLDRVVALKMILSGGYAGEADLARFRTEAEAIARLQHPNIVQIYEVGEQNGLPFFSLEFCGGGSLENELDGTPLPPKKAAALVETLARAMQAAHEQGVVHRDLKPANVLLASPGRESGELIPKITDFGLAKKLDAVGQTMTGTVMGTPSYMAPEQAAGLTNQIGPACDVYALGAILYECLTGQPPFRAQTSFDTIMQVVNEEPLPLRQLNVQVPADLEMICLKCLQKEPARRYGSAEELADDLGRFRAGEAVRARPLGEWESAVRWARKHPITALLTGFVVSGTFLLWIGLMVLSLVYHSIKDIELDFALGAATAGFLAVIGVFVQPRRWVTWCLVLTILLFIGWSWGVMVYLGKPGARDAVVRTTGTDPLIMDIVIRPLVSLAVGVTLAGLLGGVSRWAARRYRSDLLTVFFGGWLGAVAITALVGCGTVLGFLVAAKPSDTSHGQDAYDSPYFAPVASVICALGALSGFGLGGTLAARVNQRRLI